MSLSYQRRGAAASMQYADRPEPLNLGREFAALSVSGPGGCQQFPDLRRHLLEYPADRAPDTVDVIYWSKERVGRRTVVSVTHLVTARITGDSPVDYVIASKQIYAQPLLRCVARADGAPARSIRCARIDVPGRTSTGPVSIFSGGCSAASRAQLSARGRGRSSLTSSSSCSTRSKGTGDEPRHAPLACALAACCRVTRTRMTQSTSAGMPSRPAPMKNRA